MKEDKTIFSYSSTRGRIIFPSETENILTIIAMRDFTLELGIYAVHVHCRKVLHALPRAMAVPFATYFQTSAFTQIGSSTAAKMRSEKVSVKTRKRVIETHETIIEMKHLFEQ